MFPSQLSQPPKTASEGWRAVEDPSGFEVIFDTDVNLVIWRRGGATPAIDPSLIRPARRLMRSVRSASVSERDIADALELGRVTAFATDIARLVELFAALSDTHVVGLRLESTDRQTCPKWHTDRVGLRLMTTYTGPGTEWLDGDATRRASAGDVLAAKGELWPCAPGACVHRSPNPHGAVRLLLTLDELR